MKLTIRSWIRIAAASWCLQLLLPFPSLSNPTSPGATTATPHRAKKILPRQATPLWVKQLGTEGADHSYGVATDNAGNVYITGETTSSLGGINNNPGSPDAWVAKYSSSGIQKWVKQLGTTAGDYSYDVATDSAGNVYITGRTDGSLGGPNQGNADAWVAKYNSNGQKKWVKQIGTPGDDRSYDVATDSAGNVYITGQASGNLGGPFQGGVDAFVAKYDSSGNQTWIKQLGGNQSDLSYSVATDSAGNVYISGSTGNSLGGPFQGVDDAFVAKYDSNGNQTWIKQLGTTAFDRSYGVATDSAGNVYISGLTEGSLKGTFQGVRDAFVAKYDSNGNQGWVRQLGTTAYDESYGVATDSAGNVYIAGATQGALGGPNQGTVDAWVAKYNSSGQKKWVKQFGTSVDDSSNGVATDSARNKIYVSGTTNNALGGPHQGAQDAFVAKFDTSP